MVFYDPQVDIAVLYVPGLNLSPLRFAGQAQAGADAVVAGYPLNHAFTAGPARIGEVQQAVGPDIYQTGPSTGRSTRSGPSCEPGNSGGPLLCPPGTSTAWSSPRRSARPTPASRSPAPR